MPKRLSLFSMKYIYEAHDLADISQIGGKGHHLQKLASWDAERVDPEVK
jgi:hypothetical protein